jgi:hypothetical protein
LTAARVLRRAWRGRTSLAAHRGWARTTASGIAAQGAGAQCGPAERGCGRGVGIARGQGLARPAGRRSWRGRGEVLGCGVRVLGIERGHERLRRCLWSRQGEKRAREGERRAGRRTGGWWLGSQGAAATGEQRLAQGLAARLGLVGPVRFLFFLFFFLFLFQIRNILFNNPKNHNN